MSFRRVTAIVVCAAGLAVGSSRPLAAQQPPQDAAVLQLSNPEVSSARLLLSGVAADLGDSEGLTSLSLLATTYGNQLGVEVGDVDAALRTQLEIEEGVGVVVTGVNKDSAAGKAGLEPYDLVLRIGDQKIAGIKLFHDLVGNQQEKTVEFHVLHKGKPTTLTVAIPKRELYQIVDPNARYRITHKLWAAGTADGQKQLLTRRAARWLASTAADSKPRVEQLYRIGVNLSPADDTLRSQLRLAAGEGLVVTEVLDDSAAAKAGIQKNDVWTKLDGRRLTSIEAVNAQVQEIKDRQVTVTLYRGGSEISVEVTPRLVSEPNQSEIVLQEVSELIRQQDAVRRYQATLNERMRADAELARRPAAVADQLAAVKKQLAELQKAVEALEGAVAAAAKTAAPPDEKK